MKWKMLKLIFDTNNSVTSNNYCIVAVLIPTSLSQIGAVQGSSLTEHDAYTKSRTELVVLYCQQSSKYIVGSNQTYTPSLILHVSLGLTDTKNLKTRWQVKSLAEIN